MKKLIIILAPLFLSGCFYQIVPYAEIQIAEMYCKDRQGVKYISSHAVGRHMIECNDSTYIGSALAAKELLLEKSK